MRLKTDSFLPFSILLFGFKELLPLPILRVFFFFAYDSITPFIRIY